MQDRTFQARLVRVRNTEEARELLLDALTAGSHDNLADGDDPFELDTDVDLEGMLLNARKSAMVSAGEGSCNLPFDELGSIFADAAWELCLEGLLRPGPRSPNDRSFPKASGFSLTRNGQETLLLRGTRFGSQSERIGNA
jgi:hypothetical protein